MVQFFFVALLALSSSIVGLANPVESQVALQTEDDVRTLEKWEWHSCLDDGIVNIDSINVTPDPPQPGKNLTVKVEGTAEKVIKEGAYAQVVVKIGLIKLLDRRFDICEEARSANATIQCPIEKGSHAVEHTVALPREIPKAKFRVTVKGFSEDEEDMFCLELMVDFMKNPFPRLAFPRFAW